jgi:hypothetical protein
MRDINPGSAREMEVMAGKPGYDSSQDQFQIPGNEVAIQRSK